MKPVSELLKRHDSAAWRTSPDTSVFDALSTLARFEVGALMVMDGDRLVGFLSERDYTRKVALQGKNSKEVKVREIMTPELSKSAALRTLPGAWVGNRPTRTRTLVGAQWAFVHPSSRDIACRFRSTRATASPTRTRWSVGPTPRSSST
jgi:hypothetical protein